MADENVFAVSIDDLERDGVHLKRAGELAKQISARIDAAMAQYPDIGGDGPIGDSINKNYEPAAKAAADFARALSNLLDLHGGKTAALADLFGDVNDTATDDAKGGRKG
jgi:hypothetical protein